MEGGSCGYFGSMKAAKDYAVTVRTIWRFVAYWKRPASNSSTKTAGVPARAFESQQKKSRKHETRVELRHAEPTRLFQSSFVKRKWRPSRVKLPGLTPTRKSKSLRAELLKRRLI